MASLFEELGVSELKTKKGAVSTADALKGKHVGLYFSASWW